ncbi:MAG TPA: DUF2085 domain-containing protein [Blastocatellia bacterium]|nr:DUF2085 domain-containing protein [Blastocatellia bacterium]
MKSTGSKVEWLAYLIVVSLASAWVFGLFLVPLLAPDGGAAPGESSLAALFHFMYGRVCHQNADRSFHIAGHPLAVCARCSAIYIGYLIGLIAYPIVRPLGDTDLPRRRWLIAALVPVGVDTVGGYLGIFENTLASRALTGFVAGAAGVFYTLPGLVSLAASLFKRSEKDCVVIEGPGMPVG